MHTISCPSQLHQSPTSQPLPRPNPAIHSAFGEFSLLVFRHALQHNLPTWGTCQGFEQLVQYSSISPSRPEGLSRDRMDAEPLMLPLRPAATQNSTFWAYLPPSVEKTLVEQPITINMHVRGYFPRRFKEVEELAAFWKEPVAVGVDKKGVEFVAVAEAQEKPVWITQ